MKINFNFAAIFVQNSAWKLTNMDVDNKPSD